MNDDSLRETLARVLRGIAPEADLSTLGPDADLREELDLDSMDFLHFVVGLHEALGVDIPEADYKQVSTVAGCVAYLKERTVD